MTIPTLVSKYQKHSYVTGLKKAYSNLSNAMALAMRDDEVLEYYSDGRIDWSNSFSGIVNKYMKVVKTCDSSNYSECVEVDENGEPIQGNISGDIFVTADGMTWGGYNITVDINGKKGPNRWGRDIFIFEIADSNRNGVAQGTVIPVGSRLYAKYVHNADEIWDNYCTTEIVNRDGRNIYGGAKYCTGRVLEEGAMNY